MSRVLVGDCSVMMTGERGVEGVLLRLQLFCCDGTVRCPYVQPGLDKTEVVEGRYGGVMY